MTNWRVIEVATLSPAEGSWHTPDHVMFEKLKTSLLTHGQLRPIIVRDGLVIEGRQILRGLRENGAMHVWACEVDTDFVPLSLEINFDINYAMLASAIKDLMAAGVSAHDLSRISPFSAEKIEYYRKLVGFDWGQFKEFDDQQALWEEEEQQVVVPAEPDPEPGPPGPTGSPKVTEPKTRPIPSRPAPVTPRDILRPPPPQRAAVTQPPPPPEPPKLAATPPPPAPSRAPMPATQPAPELRAPLPAPDLPDIPAPPAMDRVLFLGGNEQRAAETAWRPQAPPSLDGIDEIEIDTETTGLKWYAKDRPIGIAIRLPDGRCQYLPWGHAGGNLDEAVVRRWAQRELRGKRLTGANIGFDVHQMYMWGIDLEEQGCTVSDVQHYAALLDDYRRRFSLDDLAKDYLGLQKTGQDLDKNAMAEYHASAVAAYAEHDVHLTGELKKAMWPKLTEEGLHKVRELEDQVIYVACEMERNAAPIDRDLLLQWVSQSEAELNRLLMTLAKETGFQVNPDRSDDMQKLFDYLKIPVTVFTEKGAPSFTDAVLANVPHPLVQTARRAGKLASLRSKFLVSYANAVGDDGLLRFSLHQLRGDEYGTNRGRFSASHKNIQQVMSVENQREAFGFHEKDASHDDEIYLIRKLFIAATGDFLSADAEQIEYRLGAHFAASAKILAAYAENPALDYHDLVMNLIRPYKPDITRKKAKTLNFAKVYGAGRDRISESLGIPREESDKFVDIYDSMFPEVKDVLNHAARLAEQRGYVKTILGRRARFPDKRFCHKAFNAVDQGSAADIFKQKLVEIHSARKVTGFVLRMPVHDEVCGDAPDPKCKQLIYEILNRQSFSLKVPITWKVQTGKNWAEC